MFITVQGFVFLLGKFGRLSGKLNRLKHHFYLFAIKILDFPFHIYPVNQKFKLCHHLLNIMWFLKPA